MAEKLPLALDQGAAFTRAILFDSAGQPLATAALGAALFAGLAAGVYDSLEAAAAARPDGDNLAPSLDSRAREAAYALWLDAVARVRS